MRLSSIERGSYGSYVKDLFRNLLPENVDLAAFALIEHAQFLFDLGLRTDLNQLLNELRLSINPTEHMGAKIVERILESMVIFWTLPTLSDQNFGQLAEKGIQASEDAVELLQGIEGAPLLKLIAYDYRGLLKGMAFQRLEKRTPDDYVEDFRSALRFANECDELLKRIWRSYVVFNLAREGKLDVRPRRFQLEEALIERKELITSLRNAKSPFYLQNNYLYQAAIALCEYILEELQNQPNNRQWVIENKLKFHKDLLYQVFKTTEPFNPPDSALSADVMDRLSQLGSAAKMDLSNYGLHKDLISAGKHFLDCTELRAAERDKFAKALTLVVGA